MQPSSSIHAFLQQARVPYMVVPHRAAFTAQEEAAATHVPGRDWAKVVIFFVDGRPIEAVLPAPMMVNFEKLLDLAGGSEIRLAHESELPVLFPGCETGAMPPLGPIYGQSVFVDVALASESQIVFEGGTHTEAVAMHWPDFARSVRPIVGSFAEERPNPAAAFATWSGRIE